MSSRIGPPIVASVVGIVTGIYIFQPLLLEQLQKDGNLKPQYANDAQLVSERLGDLTSSSKEDSSDTKS